LNSPAGTARLSPNLRLGHFGSCRDGLREKLPRSQRPNQQRQIRDQDNRKRQRRKKLNRRPASFHNFDPQHCGDQPTRQKPNHKLALMRRETAPRKPPRLYGEPPRNKNRPKTPQREDRMLPQPRKFNKRPQQHKEKRANQERQLAMKREHLPMMLSQRFAMLRLHGRLSKPIAAFRSFAQMNAFLRRRIIRKRQPKHQHGDQIVPVQRVNTGIYQQHGSKRQNMPEALLGEQRQKIRPQNSYKHARCDRKNDAGK